MRLILALVLLAACGQGSVPTNGIPRCVEGASVMCACDGTHIGVQTCNDAGYFDTCAQCVEGTLGSLKRQTAPCLTDGGMEPYAVPPASLGYDIDAGDGLIAVVCGPWTSFSGNPLEPDAGADCSALPFCANSGTVPFSVHCLAATNNGDHGLCSGTFVYFTAIK